jgi:hypothetical protein
MPGTASIYDYLPSKPRDNWIVCGSGYLQHMGDSQGIPALAAEFEERYKHIARIDLRRWDDNWDDLAEWIFRRCSSVENIKLMCICYSWGVGFGFKQFAHACMKRGILISGAVLSDGVAHLGGRWCHNVGLSQVGAFWPPRSPCFSRVRRLRLWLPGNINKENTYWFTQENSLLRGHDIYWEDTGEMAVNKRVIRFREHRYMDESPEFRNKAIDVANQLFGVGQVES